MPEPINFISINYGDLNPRQKESYNFQKVSALLADYGYITIWLSQDWMGADFIAQHQDGHYLKVQLKARMTVSQNYLEKGLYICFPFQNNWYLIWHDDAAQWMLDNTNLENNAVWQNGGNCDYATPNPELMAAHAQSIPPVLP